MSVESRLDERISAIEELTKTSKSTVGDNHQLTHLLVTLLTELSYIKHGKTSSG